MKMTKKTWLLLLAMIALLTVTALAEAYEIMPIDVEHEHFVNCDKLGECAQCGATGPEIDALVPIHVPAAGGYVPGEGTKHVLPCWCNETIIDEADHWRYCDSDECSVCGADVTGIPTDHHRGGTKPKGDETSHWDECTGCGERVSDLKSHTRLCSDTKCSFCGEICTDNAIVTHGKIDWRYDDEGHWKGCTEPGCNYIEGDRERHSVTCADPSHCTVCKASVSGYDEPHTASGYEHNLDSHWQTCTVCGQEFNRDAHSLNESGACVTCGAQIETQEPDPTDPPEATNTPEPTDPTDPTDPPEATNTPEPTDPTDPPETTNTPEPTDPTDPTDPPETTNTPEPTDSTDPTDPPETTNTPEPTDPTDPTDPPEVTNTPETDPTDVPTPEETEEPELTEAPTATPAPTATVEVTAVPTEAPTPETTATAAPTATPAPTATVEVTAAPTEAPTPVPTATPRVNAPARATATPAPAQDGDSFLSRFRSNSSMAADGNLLAGEVEETVTLMMDPSEESGYKGSDLTVFPEGSRGDGVEIQLNCRYEQEVVLGFRSWQESVKGVEALRQTEHFGSFVELAEAMVQALLPEETAENVEAIVAAVLQSGFDGTLESADLSAVNLDEDVDGEIVGYVAQEGYEIFLVLNEEAVSLLVRKIN